MTRIYPKGQSSQYCKVCGEYHCQCPFLPSEKDLGLFSTVQLELFLFLLQHNLELRNES